MVAASKNEDEEVISVEAKVIDDPLDMLLQMNDSEAASKNRRGRPPVLSETKRKKYEDDFYLGRRSATNMYYVSAGCEIAISALGYDALLSEFNIGGGIQGTRQNIKNKGILEQVGRMSVQDSYDDDLCKRVLQTALRVRNEEGWTVKQVERWIRTSRKTGTFFRSRRE